MTNPFQKNLLNSIKIKPLSFALQCFGVKINDGESYFSRNNNDYYELSYTNLEYVTHVNLEWFDWIHIKNIKNVTCPPSLNDYNSIAERLLLAYWKDKTEIINNVHEGKRNFFMN